VSDQRGITSTDAHSAGLIDSNDSDDQQVELLEALRAATLGEYDVYSELGRGGMATVFLALELSLNRSVAIKVMSPAALNHKTLVDRFWHEARTAASLSHPHIIPIYAVRSAGGLHFFIMKHVDGGSLDSVLRTQGELALPLVTTILTHASSALAYAHRQAVIHRDVKPANIMLDKEGFAIVMDFGIAKVRDMALTTPGIMVGTPLYMSPEQISGGVLDGRSDQYSLGIVAFELLTGRRPFSGETMPEVLRGHFIDTPPDVRDMRRDCPSVLAKAINRMLAKEPADRYPSLETVLSVLGSIPRAAGEDVREKIISLARSISISQPRISQPASPLPITATDKRLHHSSPASQTSGTVARFSIAINRRPLLTGAIGVVTFAAIVAFVATGDHFRLRSDSSPGVSQAPVSKPIEVTQPAGSEKKLVISEIARADSATALSSKPIDSSATLKPRTGKKSIEANLPSLHKKPSTSSEIAPKRSVLSTTEAGARIPANDSIALRNAAAIVVPTPLPPPSPPAPPAPAVISIGSRIPEAGLYVDGSFVSLIGGLRTINHKPGQIRLQIKAEDCVSWDSVFFVAPGDTLQIGFRNPKCVK
jgi:serine/threonine protein kinase